MSFYVLIMLMFINAEQKMCFHIVSLWLWTADGFALG